MVGGDGGRDHERARPVVLLQTAPKRAILAVAVTARGASRTARRKPFDNAYLRTRRRRPATPRLRQQQLGNMAGSDDARRAAARHVPLLILHPDETAFPCSGDYLVRSSRLWDKEDGRVCERHVSEQTLRDHDDARYALDPCPGSLNGEVVDGLGSVPIYYHTYECGDRTYVQYIFVYANNPGYRCCGLPLGRHKSDVEHVTLELQSADGRVLRVYFSAHGHTQGQWVPAGQCEWHTDGRRLRVYAARGSHACYPRAGTYVRALGVANDVCGDGLVCDLALRELPDAAWTKFAGTLTPTGVSPPRRQAWFGHENGVTLPWWKRVFCCCLW